jgi:sulfur-oxidizing protein SoxB
MSISRREFLQVLATASAMGIYLPSLRARAADQQPPGVGVKPFKAPANLYELPAFGNLSVLHLTDTHAQLKPMYFREPNVNIGVGNMRGRPPHLVGDHLLKYYDVARHPAKAYAFTYLDFVEAARELGALGGFAHLATLVEHIRAQRPDSVLLDGGDTWQGSATSLWTKGQDMVDAQLLLGVDAMTGHWEFTYGAKRVMEVVDNDFKGKLDFLAQNVFDKNWGDAVFKPYVIKEINGVPTAIIGQAFPYTPIANPSYMIPKWTFGIHEQHMQKMVSKARSEGARVVLVLSHNGMDVDLKMASRVRGIDVILGGHTHDVVPEPMVVNNAGGKTLVTNAGCSGTFLGVLDLDIKHGKMRGYRYKLMPIFSNLLEPDATMAAHVAKARAPYADKLDEPLAVTDGLLYRRGNFNGTFDQVICDGLMKVMDTEIAFSPGFRWGPSVLPGQPVTMDDLMSQTAITYATVTVSHMTGKQIKATLEDVADNLFNKDPYYQQGGDMVRVGGLKYTMDPTETIGHRISDMELHGKPLDANKRYSVAGWANVHKPLSGRAVYDVVAEYLRSEKTVQIKQPNQPKLRNIVGNPGYEAYAAAPPANARTSVHYRARGSS